MNEPHPPTNKIAHVAIGGSSQLPSWNLRWRWLSSVSVALGVAASAAVFTVQHRAAGAAPTDPSPNAEEALSSEANQAEPAASSMILLETETVSSPGSAEAVMTLSTCDPSNELSQTCCDALAGAGNAIRLGVAMEVCDPGTTAAVSGDCITGTCNGAVSCKKLKKLCKNILVHGTWSCDKTTGGSCTGGTCKKCF